MKIITKYTLLFVLGLQCFYCEHAVFYLNRNKKQGEVVYPHDVFYLDRHTPKHGDVIYCQFCGKKPIRFLATDIHEFDFNTGERKP